MNRTIRAFAVAVSLAGLVSIASASAQGNPSSSAQPAVLRFGLFVGANNGGGKLTPLRYAETDAESMAKAMYQVGGVRKSNSDVLLGPTPAGLERRIDAMKALIHRSEALLAPISSTTTQFVFYYSGHSDANGLLLDGRPFSYRRLHDDLKTIGTDVKIVILDSCDSGAFIQAKGGTRVAPFLFDQSSKMEGQVYLTSSAANESSEESDLIRGSFFTKALISAMRGAADYAHDGLVTVSEAYQFARAQTIRRTQYSIYGPEDPTWHIALTGTGNLVLSDINAVSSGVTLGKGVSGRILIWDQRGNLVVELHKARGVSSSLGLVPGAYRISESTASADATANVTVPVNEWLKLPESDFREHGRLAQRLFALKGSNGAQNSAAEVAPTGSPATLIEFSLAPGFAYPTDSATGTTNFGFSLLGGDAYDVRGAQFGVGLNIAMHSLDGAQIAAIGNIVGGSPIDGSRLAMRGAQLGGIFNITAERARGMQGAVALNVAKEGFSGLQAAGGLNLIDGPMSGIQIGAVNSAPSVSGLQIGVVNISGEVHGVQVGVVNISRNGLRSLSYTFSENGTQYLSFESGSSLYSVLIAGWRPGTGFQELSVGAGLGLQLRLGWIFGNVDLEGMSTIAVSSSPQTNPVVWNSYPAARAVVGVRLGGLRGYLGWMFAIEEPWSAPNPYAFQGSSWSFQTQVGGFEIFPRTLAGFGVRL